MANTAPHSWAQKCLVSLHDGTTTMSIAALLTPSDLMDLGDKEVEFKPNLAGGRTMVEKPEEDTVVTFEGYFVGIGDADSTAPDGLVNLYYQGTDASTPYSVANYTQVLNSTRKTWQAWFLWSDDSTVSAATGAIVSGANALRARLIAGCFVSCKPNFSDNDLKWTFKFRFPARTKTGLGTITWESADGLASMTSLGTAAET